MHYGNLVIIPIPSEGESIESLVKKAMGPHEDDGGFWDWYQIGGRWSGSLDGYQPEEDPQNKRQCCLCQGTGKRNDNVGQAERLANPDYGCNGCGGTGIETKWPTDWARHNGDVQPLERVKQEHINGHFYRIVEPDGTNHPKERYNPDSYEKGGEPFTPLERPGIQVFHAKYPGHLAVVVDNHS